MIVERVIKTIEKYKLISIGDKILVGLSGGPDSVALFHILYHLRLKYKISLIASHLNHGLRDKESEKDALFVKELTENLKIPLIIKKVDVQNVKEKRRLSLEEAGRILRYEFFKKIFKENKMDKIALGHQADDQAETFLINLLRGSGSRGLGGIYPKRDIYIRPLIEVKRNEIIEYLKARNLSYRIDSSNADLRFLRNKIRHKLIPFLEKEYNPRIKHLLIQSGEILRYEDEFLDELTEKNFKGMVDGNVANGELIFDIKKLNKLQKALKYRVFRRAIHEITGTLRRINFKHLEKIEYLCADFPSNKSLSLPFGFTVLKSYDKLIFSKFKKTWPFYYILDSILERLNLNEINKTIKFEIKDIKEIKNIKENPSIAFIDFSKITLPFIIRNFGYGDLFQPLGMKGKKKLKDFFIDKKVPLKKRAEIPLVLSENQIIWVGGMMISDRVKVKNNTKRILKLELVKL
jgi:tRNA(Ile)-lysidine synthase